MPDIHSTRTRALTAAVVAACAMLAAAEPARGGTYGVAICNPDLGAWHADASFARTSRHYRSAADCGVGGDGLSVANDAESTHARAWGAWTVMAPAGTVIARVNVSAAGSARGGHAPELLTGPPSGQLAPFGTPGRTLRRYRWAGTPAQTLAARLRCGRASGCGRGDGAAIHVKRIALRLVDRAAPTLGLGGSLLAPGSRRGLQAVEPSATDVGSGVRRFLLQVNGKPVTSHTTSCRLAGHVGQRLRPCPGQASASFAAATASPPFRQGPNTVRVCAADLASTTAANRDCAKRRVRIDNACPISGVMGGGTLHSHLHRAHRRVTIAGRLLDREGTALGGAGVCVAARVRTYGAAERVIATPTTGADGRFRVAIPRGPSREVRIAYWATDAAAIERYLDLRARVHPHLSIRPGHPIRNGNRARFEIRLPGPANPKRHLRIQVRAGRRWLDLRSGRTNGRGVYRARYRFHDTTGRRRYAFRAVVPKQPGYPYEAGRSRVRRVTVVGR